VRGGATGSGAGRDARGAVVWTSGPSSKSPPVLANGPPPIPTALGAPSPPARGTAPGSGAPPGGAGTARGACGLGRGSALLTALPWDSEDSPPAVTALSKTFAQALVLQDISATSYCEREPRRHVGHVHARHLSQCTTIAAERLRGKPGCRMLMHHRPNRER
jgi:hypothetical protein